MLLMESLSTLRQEGKFIEMKKRYDSEDLFDLCLRIDALTVKNACPHCGREMAFVNEPDGGYYDCACGYAIGFSFSCEQ